MPTGVTEEVTELFVPENKLDLALSDAKTLPTVSITKVTNPSSMHILGFDTHNLTLHVEW